jgi:hypothetical protein
VALYLWNGKLLMVNGKFATHVRCCCGGPPPSPSPDASPSPSPSPSPSASALIPSPSPSPSFDPSPPIVGLWYCTRVRQWGPGTDCQPLSVPVSDDIYCMNGADIAMYGGWASCFDYGSGTVRLDYLSGPYATNACGGNC